MTPKLLIPLCAVASLLSACGHGDGDRPEADSHSANDTATSPDTATTGAGDTATTPGGNAGDPSTTPPSTTSSPEATPSEAPPANPPQ